MESLFLMLVNKFYVLNFFFFLKINCLNLGGWDPSWDKIPKIFPLRPLKGHKNERTRIERYFFIYYNE